MKLKKINEDERGSIHILTEDFKKLKEVTILKTKRGFARGGCVHNLNNEYVCLIEGRAIYNVGGKFKYLFEVGQTIIIPKGVPHLLYSDTDSVVMEWGCLPEEKKVKHPKFRAIVEDINAWKK